MIVDTHMFKVFYYCKSKDDQALFNLTVLPGYLTYLQTMDFIERYPAVTLAYLVLPGDNLLYYHGQKGGFMLNNGTGSHIDEFLPDDVLESLPESGLTA